MLAHRLLGATRVAVRRASSLAPRLLGASRPVASLKSTLSAVGIAPVRGLATKARSAKRASSPAKSRRARTPSKRNTKSAVSRARSSSRRRATSRASKAAKAKAVKAKAKAARVEARRERKAEKHAEAVSRRAARRSQLRDQREARRAREQEHRAVVRENVRARKLVKREKEDAARMFKRLRVEAQNRGDPARPPRALSAYMLYHRSVFASLYDKAAGVTAATKKIAEQWKGLSAEQKAPFEAEAKAAKEKQTAARDAYDSAIPKQPLTPFFAFSKEKRSAALASLPADVKSKSLKEQTSAVAKELAGQWKTLSAGDKARYVEAYNAEKEKFEAAKAKYVDAQLALLPAEFREMVRAQLPGRVTEVAAWVGRVRELLARESAAAADASAKA